MALTVVLRFVRRHDDTIVEMRAIGDDTHA